jgi:hypothetical protein
MSMAVPAAVALAAVDVAGITEDGSCLPAQGNG